MRRVICSYVNHHYRHNHHHHPLIIRRGYVSGRGVWPFKPHFQASQAKKAAAPPPILAQFDSCLNGLFKGQEFVLRYGDHLVVIGPNGSGKTLFYKALGGKTNVFKNKTDHHTGEEKPGRDTSFMYMSFSMHGEFVAEYGDWVVADVLGGAKDPLARRLIVTLGLYPVWAKKISWLSTGEIRRVLLAAVLSKSPKVLVLDKPFDGLDVHSRESLKMVLSQLCQGFPRLLVDLGAARRNIPRTSMILITHRYEEIPDETTRVVFIKDQSIEMEGPVKEHKEEVEKRLSHVEESLNQKQRKLLPKLYRPQVPRAQILNNQRTKDSLSTVLEMHDVRLQKGDYVILEKINWKVQQGQNWLIKGYNGAGKSTIIRLIVETMERRRQQEQPQQQQEHEGRVALGVPHIGIVSTEIHLKLVSQLASERTDLVLLSGLGIRARDKPPPPYVQPLLDEWGELLGIGSLYHQQFGTLSQGQQNLVLIARALVAAPSLLVMDEACQGLDSQNRAKVINLLETIAKAAGQWLAMLYVSHYADEIPSTITHVLELEKGKIKYLGPRSDFDNK